MENQRERNENEDPSWTPEEADAAYKKENDDDREESNKQFKTLKNY